MQTLGADDDKNRRWNLIVLRNLLEAKRRGDIFMVEYWKQMLE